MYYFITMLAVFLPFLNMSMSSVVYLSNKVNSTTLGYPAKEDLEENLEEELVLLPLLSWPSL
ncbi:hypothetical protein BDW62DRAFT_19978 [Aspergillus aurantiobrunneus]